MDNCSNAQGSFYIYAREGVMVKGGGGAPAHDLFHDREVRGYPSEATLERMDGKKVIDIPEIEWKDYEWKGGCCTLRYKRDSGTDELGLFTLTVPSSMLAPDKSATLGVTAKDKNSRRWLTVMEP